MIPKTLVMPLIILVCVVCVMRPATAEVVNIPDANLRAAIHETLNTPEGDALTEAELLRLTELDAPEADISDLTGLAHATNLTELRLLNNAVSDIIPYSIEIFS